MSTSITVKPLIPGIELKRPKYHQSEIKEALMCGKRWEFKYIQQIQTQPTAPLSVGSTADSTFNLLMQQKMQGQLPNLEEALQFASQDFDSRALVTNWGKEDKGKSKDLTLAIVKLYHTSVLPGIQPESIQEEFKITLSDREYDIGGTFDYTDVNGVLGDTKTSKKGSVGRYKIEDSLQAALYTVAYTALRGKSPVAFRFDVMTKESNPQYIAIAGPVSEQAQGFALETVDRVHSMIKAGVALPAAEGSWWCSSGFCPFWDKCKGKK